MEELKDMVVIKNLTKKFKIKGSKKEVKEIVALDHINLVIRKGERFGLIGPNGAGKTTLIKILSTLILPGEGTAIIDGCDIYRDTRRVKNKIGVLVGEYTRALYWRLTGYKNLEFFAVLHNMKRKEREERINYLLELFNLGEWKNELVMKYSTGMKHKLALAIALLKNPPVLFLDEPLTGIDPVTGYKLKRFIKENLSDKTIIWTSHNLYEIEEVCNRIGIINKGVMVLEGLPDELKKKYRGIEKIFIRLERGNPESFTGMEGVTIKDDYTIEIKTRNITNTFLKIGEILKENNLKMREIKLLTPSLEDIFIAEVK